MPEGDSVYKLARRLDKTVLDKTVVRSDLRVPRLAIRDLAGRRVVEHATYGKHLLTRFSAADAVGGVDGVDGVGGQDREVPVTLHSHLRMDGEWSVTGRGKVLPRRLMNDVRLVLALDSGSTAWGLRLHDLDLAATTDESRWIGHLGPDPLRDDFDPDEAVRRLRGAGSPAGSLPLVSAMLDQTLVCGLGNLWANELAFVMGRSPWTPIGDVDVERLVARAATALHHSATVPGAYQVTTGLSRRGEDHWVAGRSGRPCLRCGTEVRVVAELPNDPAHRRTWWCPHCQPGPGPEVRVPSRRH